MFNQMPITKEQLLKDHEKSAGLFKIFIVIGSIIVVLCIAALIFVTISGYERSPLTYLFILFFGGMFGGLFVYMPSKMRKNALEGIKMIQNDNYRILEDRVLNTWEEIHHNSDHADSCSYYLNGIKNDHPISIQYRTYRSLKQEDTVYIVCIGSNEFTQVYPKKEWYLDTSIMDHVDPWTSLDSETFKRRRSELEKTLTQQELEHRQ